MWNENFYQCFFQRDFYDRTSLNMPSPDPLATLRNSVYWQSSPGTWPILFLVYNIFVIIESPSTNLSDCSRYLNEIEREALDLSTASHNRSLNDCRFFILLSIILLNLNVSLSIWPKSYHGNQCDERYSRRASFSSVSNGPCSFGDKSEWIDSCWRWCT